MMKAMGWICSLALVAATRSPAADPPEVRVLRPARGEITRQVTLPGSLVANQQATLCGKVAGYLASISVDRGDRVKAGQAIAEIEAPELMADLARYRAEKEVAEAHARRMRDARARSPDLITPQSVDEAEARVLTAGAELERAATLHRYTRILAPFDGIVTARFADPGAFIPSATSGGATPSAAIVTLADFNTIRVRLGVPEVEASLVQTGQVVRFTAEGLAGRSFESRVSRFSHVLDEATRTMLVEADVPNADLALRPGMYVTARVGIETHRDALLIPVEGLVMEKANAFVFVAVGDRARKTPVTIGFNDGSRVEVLSGLDEGQSVILAGKLSLADGAPVRAVEGK